MFPIKYPDLGYEDWRFVKDRYRHQTSFKKLVLNVNELSRTLYCQSESVLAGQKHLESPHATTPALLLHRTARPS